MIRERQPQVSLGEGRNGAAENAGELSGKVLRNPADGDCIALHLNKHHLFVWNNSYHLSPLMCFFCMRTQGIGHGTRITRYPQTTLL
jgi:hypothetical protein